jgi:hypothetical protein
MHLLGLLASGGGVVTSDVEPYTGAQNLALILTKPDNVPIVIMIVLFTLYTYMALRDGLKNDKLTKAGRKQDILKTMQE